MNFWMKIFNRLIWLLSISMLMACENMVEMKETNMEEMKVASTPQPQRTTRKSLEDESLLGESTGSLWMGRGQQAYLFTNNNQRLLGDLLNVTIEGYPKEQIQTKINTISKLLAEILGEQRQQIEFKQNELKKQITPPEENPPGQSEVPNRGLASVENENDEENGPNVAQIQQQIKENDKELKKIGDESNEIAELKKARDLPIKSIATHIVEIQKDGNYRIRGEQPFMIGKREYKILVMGAVRSEDYNEQGISAEKLLDPTFDIISEKKIGEL